ncbi:cytochrome P450 [Crossiella sp. SN42]|uniref:cytochrome P450 n=1 Tax=Crossiella sp. SN42 TaxID=2944808 RepID=UPI00207C1BAF|nr:cytochrome P450 [Crossiella sp. SN42]MCO1574507.1 cytochrome P450 [Crossiella sp. SN42]
MTADPATEARAFPFSAEGLRLDPLYQRLRQEEPVLKVRLPFGEQAWLVTRYQDAKLVLVDPRFSRAAMHGRDVPRSMPYNSTTGIVTMDPPQHSRVRTLVARAFTQRRAEALRPRAIEVAEELLDEMLAAGPAQDLVARYSLPLTNTLISEVLGIPREDQDQFREWSDMALSAAVSPEESERVAGQMWDYLETFLRRRRSERTDDVLGAMVTKGEAELPEHELIMLAMTVLVAGYETTASHIPNFAYVLLTDPPLLESLRADRELIPAAVEELLRWVPLEAGAGLPRYATEDIEIGGVLIRAGEPVLVDPAAANHDPAVFACPEKVDFHRVDNPHLAFSHGPHHCLGASVARMVLQVALDRLLLRLPDLRLAVPEDQLAWKSQMLIRGLTALPVTWTAATSPPSRPAPAR